jgi:Flp pilus assembly protein TadD
MVTPGRLPRVWLAAIAGSVAFGVASCDPSTAPSLQLPTEFSSSSAPPAPAVTPTIQDPADVKYYPSDEPLRLATEHFNRGNYGLAERYFRDAVEKAPRDVTAWIGLAASYDRIGRFDLADRAYRQALKLGGETIEFLNNRGYSYMLRGDFVRARTMFLRAYARDPNNPTIVNNLQLLGSSERYIKRTADP